MIKEKIKGTLKKAVKKLNSLGKKKLIALIVATATATAALTAGGVTLAKYAKEINNDKDVSAKKFYFESDLLKVGGASYNIGFNTISFDLMNYVDEYRTSEVDIVYNVSIKCDGNEVNNLVSKNTLGTLSMGTEATPTQSSVTVKYEGLELGKAYTVTANATSPYTKTISATFIVPSVLPHITYSVENTDYVTYLRVTTGDYRGNVNLTWQDGYIPDNSHYALMDAIGANKAHTANLDSNSVYEFRFYKPTSNTTFDETAFTAVPTASTVSNVFQNKTFVQESSVPEGKEGKNIAPWDGTHSYAMMTDGKIEPQQWSVGRYSSKAYSNGGAAYATVDLGGTYSLTNIKFYYFNGQSTRDEYKDYTDEAKNAVNFNHSAGIDYKIEVYRDGEWITVIENISAEDLYNNYTNTTETNPYVYFNLGGVKAEKVRIYAEADEGKHNNNPAVSWYEVKCDGYQVSEFVSTNILSGKTFEQGAATMNGKNTNALRDYEYAKLTDGIIDLQDTHTGRYSSVQNGAAYATAELGGVHSLNVIKFHYYRYNLADAFNHAAGTNYTIEVYYNGVWTTVVSGASGDDLSLHHNSADCYVYFNLGGIKAEKIRIYAEANADQYVTWYEVECLGYEIPALAAE